MCADILGGERTKAADVSNRRQPIDVAQTPIEIVFPEHFAHPPSRRVAQKSGSPLNDATAQQFLKKRDSRRVGLHC